MPEACTLVAARLSQDAIAHGTVDFPAGLLRKEFWHLMECGISGEQENNLPPAVCDPVGL